MKKQNGCSICLMIFLYVLTYIALVIFATSCNVVKKQKSIDESKSKTQSRVHLDSTGLSVAKASNMNLLDSFSKHMNINGSHLKLNLLFDKNDSSKTVTPITITKQGNGYLIDPGGRKMNNLQASLDEENNVTDSSGKSSFVASHSSKADSSHKQKDESGLTITDQKQTDLNKDSNRTSWLTFGIIVFAVLVGGFVIIHIIIPLLKAE